MKLPLIAATLAFAALTPAAALAGPIENACNRSDRQQASRALCRCIESVADRTLTSREQRRAARFFQNPDEAQTVRMSRTRADNEFWERYRAFGAEAERACAGR
jgi:cytochrome c556